LDGALAFPSGVSLRSTEAKANLTVDRLNLTVERFNLTRERLSLTAVDFDLTGVRFNLTMERFNLTRERLSLTAVDLDLAGVRFHSAPATQTNWLPTPVPWPDSSDQAIVRWMGTMGDPPLLAGKPLTRGVRTHSSLRFDKGILA
jgi:hypothetical protein